MRFAVGFLVAVLALGAAPLRGEAQPQPVTVEFLLQKLFGSDNKPPYDLTADFTGVLTVSFKNGRLVVEAEGSFHEWRGARGAQHPRGLIPKPSLPLLPPPLLQSPRRPAAARGEAPAQNPPDVFAPHPSISPTPP